MSNHGSCDTTSDNDPEHGRRNQGDDEGSEGESEFVDWVEDDIEDDWDYFTLSDLAREWLQIQLGRNCSNAVADDFFQFAWDNAETFVRLKNLQKKKRTRMMTELRKKVSRDCLPPIKMDFTFFDLETRENEGSDGIINLYSYDHFPKTAFPADRYELLSQVTRVSVSFEQLFN